ncbi:hypothetical protein CPB84DRAFT_1763390 [Gymnopilus junonius]|uniref:Uncharacterized protein n=1 Tax=Gymnopilus junonius TaxID=109634 RepID=A0A9P5P0M4_GYMJU|nr:hypothetical protein CPB84DRAFT_1763390 [Gymnopilus junonius]
MCRALITSRCDFSTTSRVTIPGLLLMCAIAICSARPIWRLCHPRSLFLVSLHTGSLLWRATPLVVDSKLIFAASSLGYHRPATGFGSSVFDVSRHAPIKTISSPDSSSFSLKAACS